MGFPISAGLLDSMVLSVVDREDTYGYEDNAVHTQCGGRFRIHIVSCAETASKKTSCLKPTIRNIWAGTDVIIMLPQREKKLLKNTAESGRSIRIW